MPAMRACPAVVLHSITKICSHVHCGGAQTVGEHAHASMLREHVQMRTLWGLPGTDVIPGVERERCVASLQAFGCAGVGQTSSARWRMPSEQACMLLWGRSTSV